MVTVGKVWEVLVVNIEIVVCKVGSRSDRYGGGGGVNLFLIIILPMFKLKLYSNIILLICDTDTLSSILKTIKSKWKWDTGWGDGGGIVIEIYWLRKKDMRVGLVVSNKR